MRKYVVVLIVILSVAQAFATSPFRIQDGTTTSDFLRQPVSQTPYQGLLDPSRISMQQQVGMSYMSSGGRGYTQGYYLNTLTYQFDAPVLMRVHMGLTNNPFAQYSSAGFGESTMSNLMNNAEFFGGADIEWRPRDNMFLRLSVHKMPPSLYNPYGYNSPYNSYGNRYSPYGYSSFTDPWMEW